MSTVHIESIKEDISNIVLMPGDPKRSDYIANKFLTNVKMVNNVRGMNAYTGFYKNKRITIFPSGMGNPSMGIYSYELFKEYDVDYIIRIGSCGSYDKKINVNDIILVNKSISESTYAKSLDNYDKKEVCSSNKLNNIIYHTAINNKNNITIGNIYSSDVFYEKEYDYNKRRINLNVLGIEMETFALFNNARKFKKDASCLLTVSDTFYDSEMLSSEEREKGLDEMILLALESTLNL